MSDFNVPKFRPKKTVKFLKSTGMIFYAFICIKILFDSWCIKSVFKLH